MHHSFSVDHAARYGLKEAIMIANFQFWILKNRANGKHQYDGRTWTYNSTKAFGELFAYMSEHQCRRTLDSLVEQGVLRKGNYNSSPYDRTSWFAFEDESAFIPSQNDLANLPNETGGSAKSTNTDSKQIENNKPSASPPRSEQFPKPDDVDEGTWADFVEVRKAKRAKITQTAINSFRREGTLAGMSLQQVLETVCTNGWQGFKAEWVHGKGSKPVAAPLKDWWTKAGFPNFWEAENAGCTERTAHLWANGERKV